MISHQFYKPHPALKEFVNNIMICQIVLDQSEPLSVLPVPPLPEHRLFFYPYDALVEHTSNGTNEFYRHIVVGPITQKKDLSWGHNGLIVKVGFQPGGLQVVCIDY